MKAGEVVSICGNAGTYVLAGLQTNEIFQIVELCFAILTSIVLIIYRIWKWYKEAKKDGKITKEEIENAIDIVMGGVNDIDNKLNNKENKDNADTDSKGED